MGERFAAWRAAAAALDRTRLGEREKRARIEIASFQLQEIDRVAPAAGEDETLMAERRVLANADRLGRLCAEAYAALYEGEQAALTSLAAVWKRVGELAELDPRFGPYLDQRDDLKSRLEDLAFFLRSYGSDIEASPDRLQAVEDRLASIERLKKKHGPHARGRAGAPGRAARRAGRARGERRARRAARDAGAPRRARRSCARPRTLSAARHAAARSLGRALVEALAGTGDAEVARRHPRDRRRR